MKNYVLAMNMQKLEFLLNDSYMFKTYDLNEHVLRQLLYSQNTLIKMFQMSILPLQISKLFAVFVLFPYNSSVNAKHQSDGFERVFKHVLILLRYGVYLCAVHNEIALK